MSHADMLTLHIPVFRTVGLFSESACVVKRLALTSKNQIAPVITVAVHNITTRQ
jgi:hypothetical protein